LTINKSISLIGQSKENTFITQKLYRGSSSVIEVLANNVLISKLTIRGGSMNNLAVSGSNCKVIDNNIEGSYSNGLDISGINAVVSNNNIQNNAVFAVYVTSNDSIISNNIMSKNGFAAIIVDYCKNVTIRQNQILSNGNPEYPNSTGGLILRWTGPFQVEGNVIENNHGFGIQFGEGCNNAIVSKNDISGNQFGLFLLNFAIGNSIKSLGSGNQVFWNNIQDSAVASVFVQRTPNYRGENELKNGTDVVSWDNGAVGNYWSDYNGHDSYNINQNNVDHYPLTQAIDVNSIVPIPTPSATTSNDSALTIVAIPIIVVLVLAISLLLYRRHRKKR
jgi:parallel beta-helix repeat protein